MWQEKYKNKRFYWGLKPSPGLKEVVKHVPKGKALDIGADEGRNSIFLAENGFEVEAIDKIKEGLEKLKNLAKERDLKISTQAIDVRKFDFLPNKYSLIISIAAIDFLKKSEIERIIPKIKKALIPGGIVYFLVFSTKDPWFSKIKKLNLKLNLKPIEENTFYLPKGKFYRHFFTQDELKRNFDDFEIILLEERPIKDISHNQPHFHQIIEFIAKKK